MSNWTNDWAASIEANPLDAMTRDQVLMTWEHAKKTLDDAKEREMTLRKYVVAKAFTTPTEGTNTLDIGNDFKLKAVINYNYNLADNDTVEKTLEKIAKVGNDGPFIADRLVKWEATFLLTEYRKLQEGAENNSPEAIKILKLCNEMLTITDKAPTLEIKEPKAKKK